MNASQIYDSLVKIAHDYDRAHAEVRSAATIHDLEKGAAQVRFVAQLVRTTDGRYDRLGEAWVSAGRRFLGELIAQDETR